MIFEKKRIVFLLPILIGSIYLSKLFYIQILESKYRYVAKQNFVKSIVEIPPRGLIKDRNGRQLVQNAPVYDILSKPKNLRKIDQESFCSQLELSQPDFKKELEKANARSSFQPFAICKNISHHDWAKIQEKLDRYPFLTVDVRLIREYPYKSTANTLGYVAEINVNQLEDAAYSEYNLGNTIGISGLEKFYEAELRGTKGVRYKIVDVNGIDQGDFADGNDDIMPLPGKCLTTTIDLDLQLYGELLLQNKKGCIVAIEPATGEILAIISSPTYDPNLLSGKNFSHNFQQLAADPNCPLFHRPIMAIYPPGSIFKIVQALIGLDLGVINYSTHFACNKTFIKCHDHPEALDLHGAIKYSCNPYFGYLFKKIINRNLKKNKYEDTRAGLEEWAKIVKEFGFGDQLQIDIPEEKTGFVPNATLYDKIHGYNNWKVSTIRSLDIGQGELLITPLQMANLAVIIANRGFYYSPHLVKKIGNKNVVFTEKDKKTLVMPEKHFEFVAIAMHQMVEDSASKRMKIPGIEVCAKTGTAQNPHGDDHSVCIAFAPKINPRIAIAVYVENAGWGARAAASTAGLMIEFYLNREIKRPCIQEYVLKGNFK